MSDAKLTAWCNRLAELQPRQGDSERYRSLWLLAADFLNAAAYQSGRAQAFSEGMSALRAGDTTA